MNPPVIDDTQLLWAARFNPNLRNLKKASQPTFTEDGTPKVRAPASVILKAADTWKDHIVAHFHRTPPPPGNIFVDLNPIWGKDGRINIICLPNGLVLIFIPSEVTRNWVIEVGCWQAGNCLLTAMAWSPTATLTPPKLISLLIWVILKDVPPQLYSLPGLSTIASGIGEPLHTEKHQLPPLTIDTRIKVEILLKKVLPKSVVVEDDDGNEVRIWVEYPRLPPKYDYCNEFGHLYHRCPSALVVIAPLTHATTTVFSHIDKTAQDKAALCSPKTLQQAVASGQSKGLIETEGSVDISTGVSKDPSAPPQSTHIYFVSPGNDSPNEWQLVTGRTRIHKINENKVVSSSKSITQSTMQAGSEQEANQIGQPITASADQTHQAGHQNEPVYSNIGSRPKEIERTYPRKAKSSGKVGSAVQSKPKKAPPQALKSSSSGRVPGKGRPRHHA